MDSSNASQQPSRRLLWIGIAVVVIVVAIIIGISVMMASTSRKEAESATASPSASAVATKEEITENLSTLDSSIKQAAKDQSAAKDAIKASTNQTKVE